MSNTARILDIISQMLASTKYRPGQILLRSQNGAKTKSEYVSPSPKSENKSTRIVFIKPIKNLYSVPSCPNYFVAETIWVEHFGIGKILGIVGVPPEVMASV